MKNKKLTYLALLFIVCIISISAVSAADDSASDIISADDEKLILEENIKENVLANSNEELILEENNEENTVLDDGNSNPKLNEETYSFSDLNATINGNDNAEINLNNNYAFNPDTDSNFVEGISIKRSVSINGNGITIDGNHLARIFHVTGKNVIISNINFVNGEIADYTGGAVFWDASDGTLTNCTFINNTANSAGALMWYGDNGHVSNCTFINNEATNLKTSGGGAILWYAQNGLITNCTFERNKAKVGGAIHFYYCSGTLSDSTFKDNSASQSGGAIYTEEISGAIYSTANNHIDITGCNFENNEAGLEGGAVDLYFSANCSIDNCNFENNTSNGCGGAIYCDGLLNNSVSNCNFTKNIANDDGGAIYWISNEGSVSNCNFDSNSAEDYGGAIYWHFNDGLITDSTFQNNIANDGGAVSGRSNVMNSNFTDNKANRNGGAINKGKAENCIFISNSAGEQGSGSGGAINEGNAINCTFLNNKAKDEGGAINEGNAVNSNFENNSANYGGAINEGNAINSNFTNNKASEDGSVEEGKSEAINNGIAVNCIFTNNTNRDTKIYDSASLIAEDYDSAYNSGEELKFKLIAGSDELSGIQSKVIIYQNGEEIGSYSAETGDGWEVILSPGEYTATIIIEELPEIASAEATLRISKASTIILANNATIEFNASRQFLGAMLEDENYNSISNALIYYEINGTLKNITTDQNGEIRIPVRNIAVGEYDVTITFNENENYTSTSKTVKLTIVPSSTMIECQDIVREYGSDEEVVITLYDSEAKAVKGVNLTVDLNGPKTYITDNRGQIKVPVNELAIGHYLATITFAGNENYTSSSAEASIDITAVNTIINITTVDISYGEEAVINFTLKDSKGNDLNGNLNVFVEGMNKTVPVENGFGSLTIPNLNAERYSIIADYPPKESYAGSMAIATFNVAKLGTQIIYKDMNTKAVSPLNPKTGEWFEWTLLDSNGKPMANVPMQIGFNGVVYDEKNGIVTDENGIAKLQINLGYKGTYTFAICYLGDENHNASFVVAKITVDTQTPTLTVPNKSYKATAKTKALTATFKTAKGTVVAGKKVSFTVNGKTYSAKTNAKGVATVKVSLSKKGTYKVNAKFAGDSTYSAVTKTATLKLT